MSKKTPARLRELSTELGAISRNLADVFLDISVYFTKVSFFHVRHWVFGLKKFNLNIIGKNVC